MARLGLIFPTTLHRGAGIQTNVRQQSCIGLKPLKDALPTELQRRGLCRELALRLSWSSFLGRTGIQMIKLVANVFIEIADLRLWPTNVGAVTVSEVFLSHSRHSLLGNGVLWEILG